MKYLKTFESLYENPLVIELKDMALELTDMGFNVQIFKDKDTIPGPEANDNILIIITYKGNFTMNTDVKEFLFRVIGYMKDNGYVYDSSSNMGRLYFVEDGRIILSCGESRERYPSFRMIKILFKK